MSTPIESLPRPNHPPHVQDPTVGPPLPVLQSHTQEQEQEHPQQQQQYQQQQPQQPSPQLSPVEHRMPPQQMYYAPLPHHPSIQHVPSPPQPPPKPISVEEPTLWQMFKDNMRLVIFVFFIILLSQMEGVRTLTQRIVHMTSIPDSMASLASKILVALLGSFFFIAGSSYVI